MGAHTRLGCGLLQQEQFWRGCIVRSVEEHAYCAEESACARDCMYMGGVWYGTPPPAPAIGYLARTLDRVSVTGEHACAHRGLLCSSSLCAISGVHAQILTRCRNVWRHALR